MENTTTRTSATSLNPDWLRGRFVVGIDGSEHSLEALRKALELAASTGAAVEAVIAWQYPPFLNAAFAPNTWSPEEDATIILRDAVDAVVGSEMPANLSTVVRQGITSAVLLHRSRTAQLLVVGSRGHGGFAGLLLGSVSAACAEHASCPVLIIHDPQAPAGPSAL